MARTESARFTHGCLSTTFVLPPPASSITHTGYTSCGTLAGHAKRPSMACTAALCCNTARGSFTRR
eukprot:7378325-Prymnesium_polylepis.2